MQKLFGTDGIRGLANTSPMLPGDLTRIAHAAALEFISGSHKHRVIIGKDTRLSGYMVESALTAGFIAAGMDVMLLGPVPTPAIALLVRSMRADLGVMISASHNPYQDNGIKFFGPNGCKLQAEIQASIEKRVVENNLTYARAEDLGRAKHLEDTHGRYIEFLKQTFPKKCRLDGLKIVVDCAHGAAYKIAPMILWELGADVIPIGVQPNGRNINENCGATCPATLSVAVQEHQADLGLALDGDGDRLIMADRTGRILNGDRILAYLATHWKKMSVLQNDIVVGTVQSNGALEQYLNSINVAFKRTSVGDRFVTQAMQATRSNLGGESSGHIICGAYLSTGDGLLAALQCLAVMQEQDVDVAEVFALYEDIPSVAKTYRMQHKKHLFSLEPVQTYLKTCQEDFSAKGRILIRPSGTEPLIRILVESPNTGDNNAVASHILEYLQQQDCAT